MRTEKVLQSLENFITKVTPTASKNSIYIDRGVHYLFDRYSVQQSGERYVLTRFADEYKISFSKIRNALAWAILDKHNKFYERNRVCELETKLDSLELEQHLHAKLRASKDSEIRTINILKYQEDTHARNKFRAELDKYINMAKYCQQRGFENELTRTSRK